MEYRLRMDEDIITFAVERKEGDRLEVTNRGQVQEVSFESISPHHLHLVVNGVGVNAYLVANGQGKTVIVRGIPYYLEDADRQVRFKKGAQAIPTDITPPMPAVVVRVWVVEGDRVKQGEPIIVVMAMKMETTLNAPYDGQVAKINVAVGDKVMPGQILVDIRKDLPLSPE